MRWLYELFNVDQIRIIFVSMFSSLLAYLTPTKGFLIALVIMFGFNIWCGMRADGVSIIRCKNFKWGKFKNALVELVLYLIIIEVIFSFISNQDYYVCILLCVSSECVQKFDYCLS